MLEYTELGKDIYIVKESTERVNTLNSILIEEDKEKNAILIDANYPFRFIDELYERITSPAIALLFSHCHTDHMAHGFYHQEKYKTPLFCPVQEKNSLLSLDALMEDNGFKQLGLTEPFVNMVRKYMKFKEAKEVKTFIPGQDVLKYNSVNLETIHIPGHSPGHTAFLIHSIHQKENRKVLFVSDIGSHPYYGDFNCNLKEYRKSIDRLETIYFSDDYILVPAHGTVYIEKNRDFFNKIRERIKSNEKSVFDSLSKSNPKSIKQLVYEGIFTAPDRMSPEVYPLYQLWDGGMIYQHLEEFIEQNLVQKVEEVDFLNDKYILI